MESFDELQLIEDISKVDDNAFDVLFLHYYPRVKGFISGLLQCEEEAEDLSQDIFMTLWTNRWYLHTISNFKAYLYRICKNSVYRHIERQLLFKGYCEKQIDIDNNASENCQTDEYIQTKELSLLIAITVERMPPQRKKIYKMSREQGMTNEMIAQALGINKRTVENHITAALSDLRKVISIIALFFT